jgi:hypothetical protein
MLTKGLPGRNIIAHMTLFSYSMTCIQDYAASACTKTLSCGHACGGIRDEENCLPCLQGCIQGALKQDADDMCMICFTEALSAAPAIQVSHPHPSSCVL